jgi:hypothetical protein
MGSFIENFKTRILLNKIPKRGLFMAREPAKSDQITDTRKKIYLQSNDNNL